MSLNNIDIDIENLFFEFLLYKKNLNKEKQKLNRINKLPPPKVLPKNLNETIEIKEEQLVYMKQLYSTLSKIVEKYVEQVLLKYDYENSVIYEQYISKETLAQLVDEVIENMKNNILDVEEIVLSDGYGTFSDKKMLRSIVESIVLIELYNFKRPPKI